MAAEQTPRRYHRAADRNRNSASRTRRASCPAGSGAAMKNGDDFSRIGRAALLPGAVWMLEKLEELIGELRQEANEKPAIKKKIRRVKAETNGAGKASLSSPSLRKGRKKKQARPLVP